MNRFNHTSSKRLSNYNDYMLEDTDDDENDDDDDDLLSFRPFATSSSKASSTTGSVNSILSSKNKKGQKRRRTIILSESKSSDSDSDNDDPYKSQQQLEEEIKSTAQRKVSQIPIPRVFEDHLTPKNLFWYVEKKRVYPVRECRKGECFGLDIKKDWDDNKQVLVQCLEYPIGVGTRCLVRRNQIYPYYNRKQSAHQKKNRKMKKRDCDNNILASTSSSSSTKTETKSTTVEDDFPTTWCPATLEAYRKDLKKRTFSRWKKANLSQTTTSSSSDNKIDDFTKSVCVEGELLWIQRVLEYAISNQKQLQQQNSRDSLSTNATSISTAINVEEEDDDDDCIMSSQQSFATPSITKKRTYYNNSIQEICDSESSDEEYEIDEPYTQDVEEFKRSSNSNSSATTSQQQDAFMTEMESCVAVSIKSSRKKEPIRAGDVIEYHSSMYVSGDKRGKRTATVMSVNPKTDPVLKLSNGEFLCRDQQVKRVKIFVPGRKLSSPKQQLHPGIFRTIDDFKLRFDDGSSKQFQVFLQQEEQKGNTLNESKRLQSIITKNRKKLEEIVTQDSLTKNIPLDFLMSSSTTTSSFGGRATKKKTTPAQQKMNKRVEKMTSSYSSFTSKKRSKKDDMEDVDENSPIVSLTAASQESLYG